MTEPRFQEWPAGLTEGQKADAMLMARILKRAAVVYKPEGVAAWMQSPHWRLDDRTPMQAFIAGDGEIVLDAIRET